MRSLTRLLATTAATAGLALAGTLAPASAVTVSSDFVTLTSADLVILPEGTCIDHPVNYEVRPPAGFQRWSLDLYTYDANGSLKTASDILGSQFGDPTTGTAQMQFCSLGFEPGVYTIGPEFDYTDSAGMYSGNIEGPNFTVKVIGKVKTKATIKAKRKGAKATVTSKVTYSAGADSAAVVDGPVKLLKQVGKKWKKVKSANTDANGTVKFKVKAPRGSRFKVKFTGMGEYTAVGSGVPIPACTSKAVRV